MNPTPTVDPRPVFYLCEANAAPAAMAYLPALLQAQGDRVEPTLISDCESELTAAMRTMDVPVHLAPVAGPLLQSVNAAPGTVLHALSAGYARAAGRISDRPPLLWQLLALSPRIRGAQRTHRTVDACVSTLEATLRESRIPKADIRALAPGAPEAAFAAPTSRLGGSQATPTVGMVAVNGLRNPGKRYFFAAAQRLSNSGIHGNWVVRSETDKPARNASLNEASRQEFLDKVDVLIVCGNRTDETLICHAMARGVPIVAASHPGTCELLETGVTGWLVPPRDPIAIARATSFLLRNPSQAIALGTRARHQAQQRHQARDHVESLHTLYCELTGEDPNANQPLAAPTPTDEPVPTATPIV